MKVFVLLTVFALLGGSHAFLEQVSTLFHNLGAELKEVGKDLVHVAEPVANSLLETLQKAGTQLLTSAASNLLSHLGGGTTTKRDLTDVVEKIGAFVSKGEEYLKDTGKTLEGAYKLTLARIQQEIEDVANDVKPLSGLFDEVKHLVTGHNEFLDDLIETVIGRASDLFGDVLHEGPKRSLVENVQSFGNSLKSLVEQVATPLKSALSGILTNLESKVLSLLG